MHLVARFSFKAFAAMLFALAMPAIIQPAKAQTSVTLEWDPNPEQDVAGYKIFLGTASGNYSQIQDVGDPTSTVLSGLTPATTYYCAVQVYNTAGLTSELSDEISFATQSTAVAGFNQWAASSNLHNSDAAPTAIPFNDGVPNLLKFAFNMNANAADTRVLPKGTGTAGLPVIALERRDAQTFFTIEFVRRKDSGLIYYPQISNNLTHYEKIPNAATTTVTAINNTWERVTIEQAYNTDITTKLFGRVEVTLP